MPGASVLSPERFPGVTDQLTDLIQIAVHAPPFSGTSDDTSNIKVLKVMAVQSSLEHFQDRLLGRSTLILRDGVSVAACFNRQGDTHPGSLARLTAQLRE